jgi:oxygen-independent coproporphyrinogen-3 oxidase
MMRHLYIHIPFCHRRCSYCDFNTYANMEDRIAAYVDALCAELAMLADHVAPDQLYSPLAMPTIFLGGGTPTMLTPAQMEQVLTAAARLVPLEGAEITTEANPGTVLGRDYLRDLRSLGINRISMGVQSLHDPTLRVLGRIHTAAEARRSYADARAAGFANINLDFIFGLPGQELAQWQQTLDEITRWEVDHFSLYSLILEERTPLFAQVTSGRVSVPDDDATAAMYEAAMAGFAAAGYRHYEISNWTHDDRRCRHNLAYWYNADYLAAGAGAHGHLYPRRYANILGVDEYINTVRAGRLPIAENTALGPADLQAETMFMGLRLSEGVSRQRFAARCGLPLDQVYGGILHELAAQGLLADDGECVRLTAQGRMLGNRVFESFV